MNPRRQAAILQQRRTHHLASNADAYAFFNLLTGPELFDQVESLLPDHQCHSGQIYLKVGIQVV